MSQRKALARLSLLALLAAPVSALWFLRGGLADDSIQPGTTIPPLLLTTSLNTSFSFEDFAAERNALFFFTVECSHCRAEFSNLSSLSSEFSGAVRFFFISLSDISKTEEFLASEHVSTPVFYRNLRNSEKDLQISIVPALYFVDKRRIVRRAYVGERAFERDKEILKEFIHDTSD